MDLRYRKAARVVACLDIIWTLFWCLIARLLADALDSGSFEKAKEEFDELGFWKWHLLTWSRFLYGSEKNPHLLMMWKFVFIIIIASAIRLLISVKLIYATKSGRNANEVLKMSLGFWTWRPCNWIFMDTGILCGYFGGNYILCGICLVVRFIFDTTIACFEGEVMGVALESNQNRIVRVTITGVTVQ